MKKFGKALLVLACIIGVTVAGVCLVSVSENRTTPLPSSRE